MIEIFDGDDGARLDTVRILRKQAFSHSRRSADHIDAWLADDYDRRCRHIVVRNATDTPVAAVRMCLHGRWPLENRYSGPLDKEHGVEFGRLAVAQHYSAGRRTLFELMVAAAEHCVALGRPHMYGMMIAPLWTVLRHRSKIPLTVLSETIHAYGERQNIVLFDAPTIVALGPDHVPVP